MSLRKAAFSLYIYKCLCITVVSFFFSILLSPPDTQAYTRHCNSQPRSLRIGARKHDLRQWVLVTSLNPLTIYFYSECFLETELGRDSASFGLIGFGFRQKVAKAIDV